MILSASRVSFMGSQTHPSLRSGVCHVGIPIFFAVLSLALFANRPAGAATCLSTPNGLVGWWPGDGNASSIVSTNNGTLVGGAIATAIGTNGLAFGFDGVNATVQIPDAPALKPTNLTVEAWLKFNGLDTPGPTTDPGQQYIIFKRNSRTANFEGYDLGKSRPSGVDRFHFTVSSSAGAIAEVFSTTVVTTNVWYHVAGVRGSNFVQIFVNGRLESQTAVSFPQDYAALPLRFGSSGESWDRKFNGVLDEVSLYNRPLSSNEIASAFAAGSAGKCKTVQMISQPQDQGAIA